MSLDINGKALTTWQVDSAGEAFRLNFESVDGQPASLTLPAECLRALLMTLPASPPRSQSASTIQSSSCRR